VTQHQGHLAVLTRVAALVAVGDWLTKAAAARLVTADSHLFSERLRLAVVHNDGTAFGWNVGTYTWQLNLILTIGAIILMLPVAKELARIDHLAPRALGLIVGGAVGNLGSLVLGPPGVVDFISIRTGAASELVLNVADFAAYVGLAMITRTGFLIVAEIRKTARAGRTVSPAQLVTASRALFADREVPLPVALADGVPRREDSVVVPRPESVRRAEVADLAATTADPKVIDIRPRIARAEGRANG
jgi:lipoprotein signal peptidase